MQLITYYAATIFQNEIGLDPFTSRILAAANGTGMSLPVLLLDSRDHSLRCVQSILLPPGLLCLRSRSLGAAN